MEICKELTRSRPFFAGMGGLARFLHSQQRRANQMHRQLRQQSWASDVALVGESMVTSKLEHIPTLCTFKILLPIAEILSCLAIALLIQLLNCCRSVAGIQTLALVESWYTLTCDS